MTPMNLERALEVAIHACESCKKAEIWAKATLDPYFPDLAPFEAAAVLRAFMEKGLHRAKEGKCRRS